ncbi:MraY family glycosyltransferase [Paenibacillus lutrae]|uniref:Undecaprenyl/decaprenyl-phosphate alpha-N-acetylglucosaminyl 1-phosphate transferase n=1 Tax=Paenibacillus lutrae TaxID=2078573 RepID=A0A7X3FKC1_9BACL|nr:MraY family glycosyltransferase [Paenibacillus lutrae]MVP01230.1 undecaprenyl/decaprenyl-phosphate alpha-N-acetylglucosaminyl 1-phosphate transferase [Paenibacillus lutrae]
MQYFIPLLISFAVVTLLVPVLRKFALATGFVDRPNNRKIHSAPIPLLGGVAIYIACAGSILLFSRNSDLTKAVLIGGTILMLTGLTDDWFKTRGLDFPVWPRLLIYIGVSTVPLWFGIEIIGVSNLQFTGMVFFPVWFVWLGTMAWVFGITNMINFIDGVDGLASGIVTIASIALLVAALVKRQEDSAMLAAILVGAGLAFLAFNFYPAKIFMGDAGAIFLGYTIAVVAIDGAFKSATFVSILVPVLALGVPIMDTAIVFTRRLLKGNGLHHADKLHTHHSLMKWGLSQTQTVSFLYLIGALFSLLSIIVVLMGR